jgi:hypothetical protein
MGLFFVLMEDVKKLYQVKVFPPSPKTGGPASANVTLDPIGGK